MCETLEFGISCTVLGQYFGPPLFELGSLRVKKRGYGSVPSTNGKKERLFFSSEKTILLSALGLVIIHLICNMVVDKKRIQNVLLASPFLCTYMS